MPDAMSLSVFLRHSTRKLWYARRESTHIDREGEVVAMEEPDALQALCYPSGGGGLAHRMHTGGDPRTRIDRARTGGPADETDETGAAECKPFAVNRKNSIIDRSSAACDAGQPLVAHQTASELG